MEDIKDPLKLQKELLKKTYLISAIPIISSLIMVEFPVLLGFIFGLLITTLMFRLKIISIRRSLDMLEGKAVVFIRNRYFVEYFIYFIVLLVAIHNPALNFLAVVSGLFMLNFVVIAWTLIILLRNCLEKKIEYYKSYHH